MNRSCTRDYVVYPPLYRTVRGGDNSPKVPRVEQLLFISNIPKNYHSFYKTEFSEQGLYRRSTRRKLKV